MTEEQKKRLKERSAASARFGPEAHDAAGPDHVAVHAGGAASRRPSRRRTDGLQKEVDAGLDKILKDDQKKQLKQMAEDFARGGPRRLPSRTRWTVLRAGPVDLLRLSADPVDLLPAVDLRPEGPGIRASAVWRPRRACPYSAGRAVDGGVFRPTATPRIMPAGRQGLKPGKTVEELQPKEPELKKDAR